LTVRVVAVKITIACYNTVSLQRWT